VCELVSRLQEVTAGRRGRGATLGAGRRAVVVGGGPVGLIAAMALWEQGMELPLFNPSSESKSKWRATTATTVGPDGPWLSTAPAHFSHPLFPTLSLVIHRVGVVAEGTVTVHPSRP
jgi:threonine dehydrogenase-like Zn-dependent dehydrogenase